MVHKPRILIVEDDSIICANLVKSLESFGLNVISTVATGEGAIELLNEMKPDLIIMDIVLRGRLNGIETAKRMHALVPVPIVFLSAYGDEITIKRANKTGPCGYIIKPFQEAELKQVIQDALKKCV